MSESSLADRVVLVTGASRRAGIAAAIGRLLVARGADLFLHSWAAHDEQQLWGGDPGGVEALAGELQAAGARVAHLAADFADPAAPERVLEAAVSTYGHVDALVACHARSSALALEQLTAAELDLTFAVNTRATLLLVRALAGQHDGREGGRVVLFTSGQHLGPMPAELPYVASKGALHQLTASLADHLAERRITVNCVNPGPTDTGYLGREAIDSALERFPAGRWGSPQDAARLVAWLLGDDARWITGQVLNSEGGFRR